MHCLLVWRLVWTRFARAHRLFWAVRIVVCSGRGSVPGYVSFFFSVNIDPVCSILHTKYSDNKSCRSFHAVWVTCGITLVVAY